MYRLFRTSVQLIDGQGGSLEMQQRDEQGRCAGRRQLSPCSREALQVAEAARAAGCKVLALTDSAASPLSLLADETLPLAIQSPSFLPRSRPARRWPKRCWSSFASRAGKPVVKRIDQAETQLSESGASPAAAAAARAPES